MPNNSFRDLPLEGLYDLLTATVKEMITCQIHCYKDIKVCFGRVQTAGCRPSQHIFKIFFLYFNLLFYKNRTRNSIFCTIT